MHRYAAAVLLAVAPVAVLAGTIYKVQLRDGSILFTDSPPPGAKVLEQRDARPTPRVAVPARPAAATAPAPAAASAPAAAASPERPAAQTLDAATVEIAQAERELLVAREKLENGREPLPGERAGTAKGGSRLLPEYEARIAGLERAVAEAEARVRRAYEARNALR